MPQEKGQTIIMIINILVLHEVYQDDKDSLCYLSPFGSCTSPSLLPPSLLPLPSLLPPPSPPPLLPTHTQFSKRSKEDLAGRMDGGHKVIFPDTEAPCDITSADRISIKPGDYVHVQVCVCVCMYVCVCVCVCVCVGGCVCMNM